MNIYVESNFILELTFMQEEHHSCEQILVLCETGRLKLIVPAYALAEPNETLIRRDKSRSQLARTVEDELRQLGRSTPYKTETDAFQAVVNLLTRSGAEERQRLATVRDRLLKYADVIPLDNPILGLAAARERQHGLSPQDALVYASVLYHLISDNSAPSCFVNRNPKDFDDPDIKDALAKHNCKLLFSFKEGHNYVQSQL